MGGPSNFPVGRGTKPPILKIYDMMTPKKCFRRHRFYEGISLYHHYDAKQTHYCPELQKNIADINREQPVKEMPTDQCLTLLAN